MKLYEILKGSEYSLDMFSQEVIAELENRIIERIDKKGKTYPVVSCLVRNKEIKLTPEEIVRQLYAAKLINDYGYPKSRLAFEYPIYFGRETKRADIVIRDNDDANVAYIIVELKKPKAKDGREQLKSYTHATGASMAVWTNGTTIAYYQRQNPNYFKDIPNIPNVHQTLEDILQTPFTMDDLVKNDKLTKTGKSLKDLILEMEDEVLANAGVDVFEEVFKLIFAKLYDEQIGATEKDYNLVFRNSGQSDIQLKNKIEDLFRKACSKWTGVFAKDAKIALTPPHLSICVSSLEGVKLFNSNLDVVDEAFEYLMSKSSKGEKGQYFTPRYVIDMCVKMLNPQVDETMIDTAAGSSGFPVHTIFHVWKQMQIAANKPVNHLFTATPKSHAEIEYVQDNVFAIDFDEKAVRVARTLNLIAGDGHTNVLHLNTLDWARWNTVTKEETWVDTYNDGFKKLKQLRVGNDFGQFNFAILMANPPFAGEIKEGQILSRYDLGMKNGKAQKSVSRDILFIERNLNFLKPGGRMAIVLPQGRFNNSSDKAIREYIAERCRILAVVGLHGNTFKPHTGTKTSVLFVQKWDDVLCPKVDDYNIFFATQQKEGKNNSGDKLYWKSDKSGTTTDPKLALCDKYGHPIVYHDLLATVNYNWNEEKKCNEIEQITPDGIAEAFVEFAKKEQLSFFRGCPFDKVKYEALLEGLEVSIISKESLDLGDRIDAEYFQRYNLLIEQRLKELPHKTLGEIATFVASAFYPAATQLYAVGDTPFIRCVDCIDYPLITKEQDESFEKIPKDFIRDNSGVNILNKNDIIITKVGSPCYASIVYEHDVVALSRTVMGLKNITEVNLLYLLAFLRSKYGFQELYREREQTIQFQLTLERVRKISIYIANPLLQDAIADVYHRYYANMRSAVQLYKQVEQVLLDELCFNQIMETEVTYSHNKFSEFVNSGRLDAEYYQPKYDAIIDKISQYPYGHDKIGNLYILRDKNFLPNDNTRYKYIELSDIGVNGEISGCTYEYGSNLPSRARRIVHAGDIIISSIEGSLQSCAIITEEYDGALCSTGFYVLSPRILNSETSLVLFKSSAIQALLKRACTGTILTAMNKDEFTAINLPVINKDIQNKIADIIRQSTILRSKSKHLLKIAKTAVETAIEQGENAAMGLLN